MTKRIFSTLFVFLTLFSFALPEISHASRVVNSGDLVEKKWAAYVSNLYNEITGDKEGLKLEVFRKALVGYYNLKAQNKLADKNLLTVVDFSLPSHKKRLWVINIALKKVFYHSLVSHGKNTGTTTAQNFSNVNESHKSSLGFYVTGSTYYGKHDLSLRLFGMDPSFNCKAYDRAIVMHGADYVSESWIKKNGMLGRSFGCPAIPMEISKDVINLLANGTCLFLYHPSKEYESKSSLLNEKLASISFFEHNYTFKL